MQVELKKEQERKLLHISQTCSSTSFITLFLCWVQWHPWPFDRYSACRLSDNAADRCWIDTYCVALAVRENLTWKKRVYLHFTEKKGLKNVILTVMNSSGQENVNSNRECVCWMLFRGSDTPVCLFEVVVFACKCVWICAHLVLHVEIWMSICMWKQCL